MTTRVAEINKVIGGAVAGVVPNLTDYETSKRNFSWRLATAALDGLPDDRGLNIAYEAVDRWVVGGHGDHGNHVALRLLGTTGSRHELSYADVFRRTNRFANVLDSLGIGKGDVVAVLCGRGLDHYVAVLGALKQRCIVNPMLAALEPKAIRAQLRLGKARILVTTAELYEHKVAGLRGALPDLQAVLVTGDPASAPEGTHSLEELLAAASESFEIQPTDPEDVALLHFTSGTTGTLRGTLHVHGAVVAHAAAGRMVLDLHDSDVFWCTADPGSVTGTSYGIISPLVCGVTLVVDEADGDPARWYGILADEQVDVWCTAATAVLTLMLAGTDAHDMERWRPHLRLAVSVGEPLSAEAVVWGEEALGVPFHDNWWQAETGGMVVANYVGMPIRPGSMGRPIPGIDAAIVACDDQGEPLRTEDGSVILLPEEAQGMLAVRAGWPSMFRSYLDAAERYEACFASVEGDRWYLSGELVRRDRDGYVWPIARSRPPT